MSLTLYNNRDLQFIKRVSSIRPGNLKGIFVLDELSGTVAKNLVSGGTDATYGGSVLLRGERGPFESPVAGFDGSGNRHVDIYSFIVDSFNPAEGTAFIMPCFNSTPASNHFVLEIRRDNDNRLTWYQNNGDAMVMINVYNTTNYTVTDTIAASEKGAKFIPMGLSWSVTNNSIKAYIRGTPKTGSTYSTWGGSGYDNTLCKLGTQSASTYPLDGALAYFCLWNSPLTDAEHAYIAQAPGRLR